MNKQQAQELIKETFENTFRKGKFAGFVKNLLNRVEEATFTYQGSYIPDAYKPYISSLERLYKYSDGEHEIDILVVQLKKQNSLERARTMQRNFIAWYLNGSRGGKRKDAALVAFVSPGVADWRFSLVKMDYRFEEGKNGKVKIKEDFTPARRWSFLVGSNEASHTAQSRLVNILADDEHNPTLKQLEEAFNIETVTKEFFLKYRELFIRTKEALDKVVEQNATVKADFDAKGVDTVNFAKKLLGQIVFLYFLQKKGWFGVKRDAEWGTGSKHFLRELFEGKHCKYTNFFNDILEPLFYEALRIDRRHDDDYYSRFNCKIPFLNGGLFDPIGNYDWVHTDINIPNELFSNTVKTKEGDIGNGILDIFDRYNFTVKEDEPLEKEVAIDPELLGKAYEKFNAIRPDNFEEYKAALKNGKKGAENKFNKKFGVYYTPREIVHYMCKQSLINYLFTRAEEAGLSNDIKKQDIEDLIEVGEMIAEHEATALIKQEQIKNGIQKSTEYAVLLSDSIRKNAATIDKWLADITVCDPAVGSGAFPVGMMHEIVRARNTLSVFLNDSKRNDYEFKRRCIEHSLYGVDIDPGAVEIAKLRLWLSLLVDEEDIKNIKPLPNLDYKIMQGNSLISEFMGINFDAEPKKENLMFKDETDELIELFQQKKDEFLNESNVSEKAKLKEEIDSLIVKIFETKLKRQKADFFNRLKNIENKYSVLPDEKQRNKIIEQEKQKLYKETGFDLETAEKQLKEFTSGKQIKPFFLWNLYFSEVFHKKGGFDVVIANPPYIQLQKAIDNKKKYADLYKDACYETFERCGDIYCLFYEKGIHILRSNGVLCFITSNKWMRAGYGKSLRKFFLKHNPRLLIDLGPGIFESATVDTNILIMQKSGEKTATPCLYGVTLKEEVKKTDIASYIKKNKTPLTALSENIWFIGSAAEQRLKEKIERVGKPLKDWDVNIYYGIKTGLNEAFIITTEKRNEILSHCKDDAERQRTEAIIKPILRGRDIKRYYYEWAGLWVIGTFPALHLNIENFPALKKYFLDNFDIRQLEQSGKKYPNLGFNARKKTGNKWFETQDQIAYYTEFEKEKVVYSEIVRQPQFYYDENSFYVEATSFLMTGKNVKYLCGLLNSKPTAYFFKRFYSGGCLGNDGFRYKKDFLERLPLPSYSSNNQSIIKQIESLVDKILFAKKQNPQANTKEYERQIDQLVYQLYGLTEEEIRIVEGEQ